MKNLILILMVLLPFGIKAQTSEYTFENRGMNIFVEADGTANKHFVLGGPSLTVGYQLNPHLFLGGTFAFKLGNPIYSEDDIVWKSPEGHYSYSFYVDHLGDTLSNPYERLHDCCGMFFDFGNWDLQLNVRYNLLAHSRWTPYADFRFGTGFLEMKDGYDLTTSLLFGNRIALTHGDRAFNFAVGYSLIHVTSNDLGMQGSFMLRLGMEF